jgi:hypothetical protein
MEDCASLCICKFTTKDVGNNLLHIPTKQGGIPTSEGCIPTSEGVILTKQANLRPYFARTNTLQTQNSRQSALFAQKTPCLGNICGFYSYPTYICTRREVLWCIWIMDLRSKIQRGVRKTIYFSTSLLTFQLSLFTSSPSLNPLIPLSSQWN